MDVVEARLMSVWEKEIWSAMAEPWYREMCLVIDLEDREFILRDAASWTYQKTNILCYFTPM